MSAGSSKRRAVCCACGKDPDPSGCDALLECGYPESIQVTLAGITKLSREVINDNSFGKRDAEMMNDIPAGTFTLYPTDAPDEVVWYIAEIPGAVIHEYSTEDGATDVDYPFYVLVQLGFQVSIPGSTPCAGVQILVAAETADGHNYIAFASQDLSWLFKCDWTTGPYDNAVENADGDVAVSTGGTASTSAVV